MANTKLYEILNVDKDADLTKIKKSYRRLALIHHPDKNPDNLETFNEIKSAYDVLSDPKKRKVYDKYGDKGITMMNSMGGQFFDEDFESKVGHVFLLATLFTLLLIIFFSFLSAKDDGVIDWRYALIFIPLFLVDGLLAVGVGYIYTSTAKEYRKSSTEPEIDDVAEEPEEPRMDGKSALIIFLVTTLGLLALVLFTAFQVLVVLKLDGVKDFAGSLVFTPLLILEGMVFLKHCGEFIFFLTTAEKTLLLTLSKISDTFLMSIIRVVQMVLIILKMDDSSFHNVSWSLVFIPAYLVGAFAFISLFFHCATIPSQTSPEDRMASYYTSIGTFVFYAIVSVMVYVPLGLLASKLDQPGSVRLAMVFVPLFMVLSVLFCCCGCCLPVAVYAALRADLSDDTVDGLSQAWGNSNKRISNFPANESLIVSSASSSTPLIPN